MDLSIYHIILKPIINSNKAVNLNRMLNKLVLSVHPKANKALVAEALKRFLM